MRRYRRGAACHATPLRYVTAVAALYSTRLIFTLARSHSVVYSLTEGAMMIIRAPTSDRYGIREHL